MYYKMFPSVFFTANDELTCKRQTDTVTVIVDSECSIFQKEKGNKISY